MKVFFYLCLLLAFCAGCFPYRYSVQPGIEGIVFDRQTKLPLANPSVRLAFIIGQGNPTNDVCIWRTNTIAVTNGNEAGAFEIPPKRKWGIYIIPMDVFSRRFEVTINHTNFETTKVSFLHNPMSTGKSAVTKLGNIQLNLEK